MQVRTIAVVVAVVGGTLVWVAASPSDSTTDTEVSARGPTTTVPKGSGSAVLDHASTSTRGIDGDRINVVFATVALKQLSAVMGFSDDVEFTEQEQAIRVFVDDINAHGGINGRTINPIISEFDPTSETNMRALCKDWTEGDPAAFAVVDGVGAWTGDNELCIAQEGHTPFIGQWTTGTTWLQQGAPYLWWTGPDQAAILTSTVTWGLDAGYMKRGGKVGVIAGDRASDREALQRYLLPALSRAGVDPVVSTIAADPSDSATTNTQAPLIIQQMRSEGVTSIIPMIPFNVFFPLLQAETEQQFFPRLLLSDYESSIQVALGLIPIPYLDALDGQEGLTTETLGGVDDDRPDAKGGYNPGVRSCYRTYHRVHPEIPDGNRSAYIEEQGPIVGWCQAIRLFAAAAREAGPHLNRRTFVQAMARIRGFAGTYTDELTYGPDKLWGPTQYRIVRLHNNDPKHNGCILLFDGKAQGTCWQVVSDWRPLAAR
jgi:hypothetical protein